jgi:hypothetical protein
MIMIDIMIIQGTTPTYEFEFEDENYKLVGADMIKSLSITFFQKKTGVEIKKKYARGASNNTCTFEGNAAVVRLTQEETFSFVAGQEVKIEMRALLNDGEVLSSDTYRALVKEVLDKEVLK